MNKDNKTLQEVLEELKVLKKKAKEEKICELEKNDMPAEKEGLSDSSVKKDDEESYMVSIREMEEVSAAKRTRTKNKAPIKVPMGID